MEWRQLLCEERIRPGVKKKDGTDLRTEFEKDYHRIIGSASFRRLQDKTQVFPLDQNDFVRTRLTHSLEVSSFAKSLGQSISERIAREKKEKDFTHKDQVAICDILQCAGLLHDIGNPPFGHFGESVIQRWFQEHMGELTYQGKKVEELLSEQMKKDFYSFEGNTQALRLVTKLHYLVDQHGMNLTKALLGTIIKYPVSSLEIDKKSGDIHTKKMGYFYAEREIFRELQQALGTKGRRHPLAYILEAADDIAYKTADIEDAYKKGFIDYALLLKELKEYPLQFGDGEAYNKLVARLEEKLKRAEEKQRDDKDNYAILNWLVEMQGVLLEAATNRFMNNYESIMDGSFRGELLSDCAPADLANALGKIAYKHVFTTRNIYKLEIAADTIMNFLLNKMVKAAIDYRLDEVGMNAVDKKMMSLVSDNYKSIYELYSQGKTEEEKLYLRLLLVTDSICGMTDSYAKRLYQELSGIL